MGETVAAIGPYLAIASAGASVGSAIMQGQAASRAANLQAQQYQEEADIARAAAVQDEANRRRALAATLATQEAIRAGRGVELYGGTGDAIRDTTTADFEADILTSRANILRKGSRYDLAASEANLYGSSARTASYFKAGAGLLSAAGTGARLWQSSSYADAANSEFYNPSI